MRSIRATLRSMLVARHKVARLEDRFLKQLGRLVLPTTHGAKVSTSILSGAGARRTLKCPRCSRRFAKPMHLGRHLSTTHKRGRKKAA
jgi:hypothetical protein